MKLNRIGTDRFRGNVGDNIPISVQVTDDQNAGQENVPVFITCPGDGNAFAFTVGDAPGVIRSKGSVGIADCTVTLRKAGSFQIKVFVPGPGNPDQIWYNVDVDPAAEAVDTDGAVDIEVPVVIARPAPAPRMPRIRIRPVIV